LEREFNEVQTPYGLVRVKRNTMGGFTPEYDDCRLLARENGVPLRTVIAEAYKNEK
jgi:uncharacterized protein (DUF111 family)